ncbi:hypothetical protein K438DRAFT_1674994 [Mycena galopus ATCC 62051]|nr:hypothetical protein K438DRAFT_1674994 [Mycena galopus ATCC 62051]
MPVSLSPALAAFVVVTIDPVATLHALNDPIATAAARKLTPQKYVGYVSKAINVFDSKTEYHTYAIQLTSPMIPAACEGEGISADMYTPVFPSTVHPSGRTPLRTRRALLWSGCQQPSFMRSIVRVPVKLEDDSTAVLLEPTEAIRYRRILAEEDEQRRVSLCASPSEKSGSHGSYVEFSDLDDDYMADSSYPVDLLGGCEDDSEEQYYGEMVQASRPPDTMVVVNVSYDLSEVVELPDPLQFFEEKRRLKELVAESRARTSGCLTPKPRLEIYITEHCDVHHPATEEIDSPVYLSSLRLSQRSRYIQLPELLSTVHIPSSWIQEVATTIRRLRYCLTHIREDGFSVAQSWMASVRLI